MRGRNKSRKDWCHSPQNCPKILPKYAHYKKKTRLKCKSSARVKIVLKKDWIVKNVKKKLKMSKNFFLKKSEKIRKNRKKSKKNNQK